MINSPSNFLHIPMLSSATVSDENFNPISAYRRPRRIGYKTALLG